PAIRNARTGVCPFAAGPGWWRSNVVPAFGFDQGLEAGDRILDADGFALAGLAVLDFDFAARQTTRSDDELERNAHQIGGCEFLAGARLAIVIDDVEAGGLELAVELFIGRVALRIARFEVDEAHLERRDRNRPDDAVLVVAGLDDGGHDAGEPDAVGPHMHGNVLAVLTGHRGTHGLGIFGAEVEDLPDLDAPRGDALVLGDF